MPLFSSAIKTVNNFLFSPDVSVSYWTSVVRPEMEHKLSDHFELGDVLGTGGFGSVHAGKRKANGETVSAVVTRLSVRVIICFASSAVCMWLHAFHSFSLVIYLMLFTFFNS